MPPPLGSIATQVMPLGHSEVCEQTWYVEQLAAHVVPLKSITYGNAG